jgi:predicted negative regulator of RcsB-dependent stress response
MLNPKKKLSKRELKEDKFVTFTLKAKDFVEENSKLLVRAAIGSLIAVILLTLYINSKKSANVEANSLLGEAQLAIQLNDDSRAEEVLTRLVENFDGVNAAGQGCFLLAKKYWEKDDFVNAKKYFKKYMDDYASDDLLFSGALAGYADCLFNENAKSEAAVYYERAARVDRDLPSTPSYLFSAALAYLESDNLEKARELAEDIVNNFEDSNFKEKAEILLYKIKFSA